MSGELGLGLGPLGHHDIVIEQNNMQIFILKPPSHAEVVNRIIVDVL